MNDAEKDKSGTRAAVHLEGLTKRYSVDNVHISAVNDLNLEISSGEIFGLLGPNGAGKTTTIESITGLRVPTEGSVRVFGLDPVRERDALREIVAVQPQQAVIFARQTVAELLRVWASFYREPASPDEVIAMLGLESVRDVRSGKLSGGQRQRLLVGTALISKPKLLVLDEPSTGMDPNARKELWEAIRSHRRSGGTILLSTHSMEEAHALCDRVAIMNRGSLAACGSPDELVHIHAPEQELMFTVPKGSDLSDVERHEAVLNVSSAGQGENWVSVRVRTKETDRILNHILDGPLEAKGFQTNEASLEEVFRRLTGHGIDEEGGESREDSVRAHR